MKEYRIKFRQTVTQIEENWVTVNAKNVDDAVEMVQNGEYDYVEPETVEVVGSSVPKILHVEYES